MHLCNCCFHRFIDQPASESTGEHHRPGRLPAIVWKRPDYQHDVCWLYGGRQRHLFGEMPNSMVCYTKYLFLNLEMGRKSR